MRDVFEVRYVLCLFARETRAVKINVFALWEN